MKKEMHNKDMEISLLTAAVFKEQALWDIVECKPDIFYDEANAGIFDIMKQLYFDGAPVDMITLSSSAADPRVRERIVQLALQNSPLDYSYIIRQLSDMAKKRALYNKAIALKQAVTTGEDIDPHIQDIIDIAQHGDQKGAGWCNMRDLADQSIDDLISTSHYVKTGIPSLDDMIIGLFAGQVICIAGSPGDGKTTLAWVIAQNINNSLFISLEMKRNELFVKMLARSARINSMLIESGDLTIFDREKLDDARNKMKETTDIIVTDTNMDLYQIINFIKRTAKSRGIKVAVIDYAQLIEGGGGNNQNERYESISRKLKLLASELNIPIIVLSQLTKDKLKENRAPTLGDLRGSGAWGQDADVVIFCYNLKKNEVMSHHVAVGKGRKIKIGKVHNIEFEKEYSNFKSLTHRYENTVSA